MDEREIINQINKIDDAIHGKGSAFDIGCNESEIYIIISKCKAFGKDKAIRCVTAWQWWDLALPVAAAIPDNLHPAIIYTEYLISDTSGRFREGQYIRTSLLLKLHDNCIFESENTFYILVGSGIRKTVDANIAFGLL